MANEATISRSSYGECVASNATAAGAYSAGSRTAIASITGITGTQKDFPLLDFRLLITSETITSNETVDIFRICSDGTNTESVASTSFISHYVGSIPLEAASTVAYLYGVSNVDQNDRFIWKNNSAASITASLDVRTRTIVPGA